MTHTLLSSYHRRWRRRHREHGRTHSEPAALPGQCRAQSPHRVAGHDRRGVTSLQMRFGPLFHSLLLYLRHFQDWLIEFLSCKSRLSRKNELFILFVLSLSFPKTFAHRLWQYNGSFTQIGWQIMGDSVRVFFWARAQRADAQCTTSCLEELLCLFSLKKCFLNP